MAYHSGPDVLSVSKSSLTPRKKKKKKKKSFDGSFSNFFLFCFRLQLLLLLVLPFWNYIVSILFGLLQL
jgi:hypothetical protein